MRQKGEEERVGKRVEDEEEEMREDDSRWKRKRDKKIYAMSETTKTYSGQTRGKGD